MAPTIKVGDTIPEGSFKYVAYTPALEDHSACGIPTDLKTDEWKGKKVVLFSVPGAFTPTCHVNHLPPYLEKYDELKSKGVDILALSDPAAQWSEKLGLSVDLSGLGGLGLGTRTARYAIILDDLVVKYVEVEPSTGVTVSGVDAILAKL
ncbi:hypothetical protein ONZ45_g7980 [Pleurotus djamor]|nr:hypothetical protein ONZ45_g7980 [Pleurotus djamor]